MQKLLLLVLRCCQLSIPVCSEVTSKIPSDHSFQRLLLLPAAGYRHDASGALTNVSTNGYYWSSSSYAAGNINAGFLNFNSGNVNPLNNGNRAAGLSVRCVQASAQRAVFIFLERLFLIWDRLSLRFGNRKLRTNCADGL